MADFEPKTWVVARDTPTLLGVGRVIDTPSYSSPRLTWAEFGPRGSKTTSAFEPGELMPYGEWIATHNHQTPRVGIIYDKVVMPDTDMPCTHIDIPGPRQPHMAVSLDRLREMIDQEEFTETHRIGRSRHEQATDDQGCARA